jgi:holo-[acyl-carrier protein] synthase
VSIFGIGLDIVQIDRIKRSVEKHGESFAKKILHPNELEIFNRHNYPHRYLAKRFAAKEAFAKALGTGIVKGVTLPRIEVTNDLDGKPELVLHETTQVVIQEKGIQSVFLAISDEQDYAVAQVVLEK